MGSSTAAWARHPAAKQLPQRLQQQPCAGGENEMRPIGCWCDFTAVACACSCVLCNTLCLLLAWHTHHQPCVCVAAALCWQPLCSPRGTWLLSMAAVTYSSWLYSQKRSATTLKAAPTARAHNMPPLNTKEHEGCWMYVAMITAVICHVGQAAQQGGSLGKGRASAKDTAM